MLFEVDTARPERNEPSRQIAQNGDANEEAHNPGHAGASFGCQHLRKQIVPHHGLHALNHTHRPLAPPLHFGQAGFGNVPRFQGRSHILVVRQRFTSDETPLGGQVGNSRRHADNQKWHPAEATLRNPLRVLGAGSAFHIEAGCVP